MSQLEIIRPVQMTRWQRFSQAIRSYTLPPLSSNSKELVERWSGESVAAGVPVNEQTAMNYAAVWAAVNLIAGHIGSVPLVLYRRLGGGGKERFDTHPLFRLLHTAASPQVSSLALRETLTAHALIWGNGYAEIERDQAGRPTALWPLLPQAVAPFLDAGRLRYRVHNPSGTQLVLDAADVLHIRGLCDDGLVGVGAVSRARESIGLGLATERFGATFFGNGSTFGGIVSYPPGVASGAGNTQTREENRKAIEKRHQGVDRAHRLLTLYEGAGYQQLGVPPEAAQFLETRKFQIEEVCRWFNIPPHKLKSLDRATFSNIEQQSIEYVTDCLLPWFRRWETELALKLVNPLEQNQQVIEFVVEGLLRGDAAGRAALYQSMFSVGAITPNEIRARENLNPLPGGDTPFTPTDMQPITRVRP